MRQHRLHAARRKRAESSLSVQRLTRIGRAAGAARRPGARFDALDDLRALLQASPAHQDDEILRRLRSRGAGQLQQQVRRQALALPRLEEGGEALLQRAVELAQSRDGVHLFALALSGEGSERGPGAVVGLDAATTDERGCTRVVARALVAHGLAHRLQDVALSTRLLDSAALAGLDLEQVESLRRELCEQLDSPAALATAWHAGNNPAPALAAIAPLPEQQQTARTVVMGTAQRVQWVIGAIRAAARPLWLDEPSGLCDEQLSWREEAACELSLRLGAAVDVGPLAPLDYQRRHGAVDLAANALLAVCGLFNEVDLVLRAQACFGPRLSTARLSLQAGAPDGHDASLVEIASFAFECYSEDIDDEVEDLFAIALGNGGVTRCERVGVPDGSAWDATAQGLSPEPFEDAVEPVPAADGRLVAASTVAPTKPSQLH